MTLFPGFAAEDGSRSPQAALNYPIGAASPLWFAYAGVAGAGVAYWWMTRWTQPANLEAAFDGWMTPAAPSEVADLSPVGDEVAETMEAAAEEVAEGTIETAEAASEVAEPAEEVMEAAADEAVVEIEKLADDLTRVVGIGPKLAARLADLGVTSFKDIASWTQADLERFDKDLDLKGRAVRDAWVAQARRFSEA